MEPIISFEMLLDQLNSKDKMAIVDKIIQELDEANRCAMLFAYLAVRYETCNHHHDAQLEKYMKYVTERIEKSKSKNSMNGQSFFNLNKISSHLTHKIATFLSCKEYMKFSRCNRQIYCALNKPLDIKTLEIFLSTRKASVHFPWQQLFRFAPKLRFLTINRSAELLQCLQNHPETTFYDLRHLYLYCEHERDTVFETIVDHNVLRCPQLNSLVLYLQCETTVDKVIKFLNSFGTLKQLIIQNIDVKETGKTAMKRELLLDCMEFFHAVPHSWCENLLLGLKD